MLLTVIKMALLNIFLAVSVIFPQRNLSIGFDEQPKSFLPHEAQNDAEKTVSNLLFRKLFKFEEEKLIPDLVEKWSISDNKKEFKLKLKDNIQWQDGTEITSNDVLYTLTLQRGLRDEIEIEKISEKEILIRLPTETEILPTILTFGIEPSHLRNQQKLKPIGSTSFHVAKVSMERNDVESVILQSFRKNKQYPRVIFRFYKSENDLKTAYKIREINTFFSETEFAWPGVKSKSVPFIGRYFLLIYNTNGQKLNDPDIRKKLDASLNTNALLKRNFYINALKTQGPISYSDYTKSIFLQNRFNPEVRLTPAELKQIDFLDVILPNNKDGKQIESFLRESWENRLKLKLKIRYEDLETLVDKGRGGEYDVLFLGHEIKPDPDRYTFWHSTQIKKGLNLARFKDLRSDKALEEGRRVVDKKDRTKHYNIFQDVMNIKVPASFLYHPGKYLYYNENTPVPLPKVIYYPSDIVKNL